MAMPINPTRRAATLLRCLCRGAGSKPFASVPAIPLSAPGMSRLGGRICCKTRIDEGDLWLKKSRSVNPGGHPRVRPFRAGVTK